MQMAAAAAPPPPAAENGHGRMNGAQRRPEGPATILGIGTAVPPFVHEQSTYPDYYFDETKCSHKICKSRN
jgi:hypothetical protein